MRMQHRWYAFVAMYALGGLALTLQGKPSFSLLLLWSLILALGAFAVFRCPHCGRHLRPKGKLFMGKSCVACGKEY
jgi:hypothetical protein